jgi:hypothetical protein
MTTPICRIRRGPTLLILGLALPVGLMNLAASATGPAAPTTPSPAMTRPTGPPLTSEGQALAAIQEEGRQRVGELASQMRPGLPDAARRSLMDRIAALKTEYRERFLQAKPDFARERGDEPTVQAALGAARPAAAQWNCSASDNTPVCTETGDQSDLDMVPVGNGGMILVWADTRNGSFDLYAQHLMPSGFRDWEWPSGGAVLCAATGDQYGVLGVTDGSGGAIALWSDERSGTRNIYAQRLPASGAIEPPWPPNDLPVSAKPVSQTLQDVLSDGSGGAFVVWGEPNVANDLYALRVRSSGVVDPAWPAAGCRLGPTTGNQIEAQLVADGSGGAIVVWSDSRSGNPEIYAHHVSASGTLDLAWPADGLKVATGSETGALPQAVSDGAGGAIVIWKGYASAHYRVLAQRVLAAGTRDPSWPGAGLPVAPVAANQSEIQILSDAAGGAFVTWEDDRAGNYDIYMQHVRVSGSVDPAWPASGRAVCTNSAHQVQPGLTSDGSNGVFVAWHDLRNGNTDIYAHHLSVAGVLDSRWPSGGQELCTAAADQSNFRLAPDGADGMIAAWTDQRSAATTGADIYAQRVGPDGDLDDRYEPNDICAEAVSLPIGIAEGTVVASGDDDWYAFGVPRSGRLAVDMDYVQARGDIDLELYSACGGSLVAASGGVTGSEYLTYTNYGPFTTVYLRVFLYSGSCNEYWLQSGVLPTSNLVASWTPADWSSPIVPLTSVYTSGPVTLPSTLPGNASGTYVEWAAWNDGPNPVPGWRTEVYLDGADLVGYGNEGDSGPLGYYLYYNRGPYTVRGGRHSLTHSLDAWNQVLETNENDNTWTGQWVWSPLVLSFQTPVVRVSPPPDYGSSVLPNCDGMAFTHASGRAWVTGLAPHDALDDYDLWVFDDAYTGSLSGFSHSIQVSGATGPYTDFVAGDYSGTPLTVYPAAIRWSSIAGQPFSVDQSDARSRQGNLSWSSGQAEVRWSAQALAAQRLVDIYEMRLDAGQTAYLSLHSTLGADGVRFEVFPPGSGTVHGRGDGVSSETAGDYQVLTYGAQSAGRYPVVVYRDLGTTLGASATYDFNWSRAGLIEVPGPTGLPQELSFSGPVQNPAVGGARLAFALPAATEVRLALFDVQGRRVRELADRRFEAGEHNLDWDGCADGGRRLGAGIYWAVLEAEGRRLTRRVVLLP